MHEPDISPQGRNTTRPRYRAGFQVSTTRSERASDPGSGPGLAVACTQHRVRAAAGCTHSGRPTGTGTRQGHRSSGAPRIKFHGAGIPGPRGSGPRGGRHLKPQLGKVLCHRHQSRWQPTRASAQRLSDQCPQPGKKHSRRARTGGPPGAPILLHVYLPTAEATKNGGAGLDL